MEQVPTTGSFISLISYLEIEKGIKDNEEAIVELYNEAVDQVGDSDFFRLVWVDQVAFHKDSEGEFVELLCTDNPLDG